LYKDLKLVEQLVLKNGVGKDGDITQNVVKFVDIFDAKFIK